MTPAGQDAAGRLEKALSRTANMHVDGESDGCVVPTKYPNNSGQPLAEGIEGRRPTKENAEQTTVPRTQRRISVSIVSKAYGKWQPALARQPPEVRAV